MKRIATFLFIIISSANLFGQNDGSVLHIYRDGDLYSGNKIAKLFLNNTLCIGLKEKNYDTLHIKPGCYDLFVNKNKEKLNKCFEPNINYYYKIEYDYIFLFGRFKIIEVTEEFAKQEIEKKNIIIKSLKK
ncbi:MAG: hypothetical protein JXB49_25010 [Bacteroidales bacterium]|nr:hypothetical protein [Bacteroidales bacterium]